MKTINISDAKQRNTRVGLSHKKRSAYSRRVDAQLQDVESVRIIKSSLDTDFTSLTREQSAEQLSQQIIDSDPEIDIELFGKRIDDTVRIYLNSDNEPAGAVIHKELVYNAQGELVEERLQKDAEANINLEIPLSWSGKLLSKRQCIQKFVFSNAFQLRHVDGLTFDFLYNMAQELQDKDAMLFLGAGPKSNEPLVISRNGKSFRGFLEGRVNDKSYLLVLHLTELELKALPKEESEA